MADPPPPSRGLAHSTKIEPENPRSAARLRQVFGANLGISGTAGPAIAKPAGSIYEDPRWIEYETTLRKLLKKAILARKGRTRAQGREVVLFAQTLPPPPGWGDAWPPVGERRSDWVFAYIRVSSKEQGKRTSALDQLEDCLRLAYMCGKRVIAVFMDDDVGTNFDRPSYQLMLKTLTNTPVGRVVVSQMNRFTRAGKLAILEFIRLTDMDAPLLYCHDQTTTELVVADMNNSNATSMAISAAWEAERDWIEHQNKTKKGVQSRVNLGIQDKEIKGGWMLFVRDEQYIEELEEKRFILQAKPGAEQTYLKWLAALRLDPSWGTIETLSQQEGREPDACVRELASPMVLGIFERGKSLSQGPIRGLAVANYDEYEEMELLLERARQSKVSESKQCAEAEIVEELIAKTSVEMAERESNGRITILCDEDLGEGLECSKRTKLNAANINGKRRDRRVCADGHRTLHPKQGVYAALNDGPGPYCPHCGMFEEVEWQGVTRASGVARHTMYCRRCEKAWDQPWDGRPAFRRVEKAKEAKRSARSTTQSTLSPPADRSRNRGTA